MFEKIKEKKFIRECSKVLMKYYDKELDTGLGFGKLQWLNIYRDHLNESKLTCLFTCSKNYEYLVVISKDLMKSKDIENFIFKHEIRIHLEDEGLNDL